MPLSALSAQHSQTPQTQSERLKCGEVYTWECAGEMYAVECALCEERPLYTLSEFAEHMEVWHSDWTVDEADQSFVRLPKETRKHRKPQVIEMKNEKSSAQGILKPLSTCPGRIGWNSKTQPDTTLNDRICCSSEMLDGPWTPQDDDSYSDDGPEPFEQVLIADDSESESADGEHGTSLLDESAVETTCDKDNDEQNKRIPDEDSVFAIKSERNENDDQNESRMSNSNELEPYEMAEETQQHDSVLDGVMDKFKENCIYEQNEPKKLLPSASGKEILNNTYQEDLILNDTEIIDYFRGHSPVLLSSKTASRLDKNEPSKLTTDQVASLIALYKEHPRLWCQTHPEFSETRLTRESWIDITQKWNEHCQKNFSPTYVRIRVSTLCQRYLKERERLDLNGDRNEKAKFVHYERLKFLDQKQPLQSRRRFLENQNSKLLEIYRQYPILWHSSQKLVKCPDKREEALRGISTSLKLCDIHLSPEAVHRRLNALRQSYRQEKVRHLHCQLEQTTFETSFVHYERMQFLESHIEPFVCSICRKIFKTSSTYSEHLNTKHGDHCQEGDVEGEEESPQINFASNMTNYEETFGNCDDEKSQITNLMPVDLLEAIIENKSSPTCDQLSGMERTHSATSYYLDTPSSFMDVLNLPLPEIVKQMELGQMEPSEAVIANVECANLTYDLKLTPFETQNDQNSNTKARATKDSNMKTKERLTVEQSHKAIELYQLHQQLWDPTHDDYNSRKLRRIAWRTLTTRLNRIYQTRFVWKTLYRRITDYTKYYKREKQRVEKEQSPSKWAFYDDFYFIDDVINDNGDLQQKEMNQRIIAVYKQQEALWNTQHPDYTKRKLRQHHIGAMSQRLLEDHGIQLMPERLRQRLVDLRASYRAAKNERIAAKKRNEPFNCPFEFYEALQFLEQHVAPFDCSQCAMSFKLRTDCLQHESREHALNNGSRGRRSTRTTATMDVGHDSSDNVCNICGMTFTLRSNLANHLKRHVGHRPHTCSMCPKAFYNSTALHVHERSHTKEIAYVCDQCGRAFVTRSKLNQHMKRHRGQRDFVCDKCGKAYYNACDLDQHVRRHLKIRDKVCPVCGKTFAVGSSYYAHMLIHDAVKRYECIACNLRFAQYAGLYKHRKRYHPTN